MSETREELLGVLREYAVVADTFARLAEQAQDNCARLQTRIAALTPEPGFQVSPTVSAAWTSAFPDSALTTADEVEIRALSVAVQAWVNENFPAELPGTISLYGANEIRKKVGLP